MSNTKKAEKPVPLDELLDAAALPERTVSVCLRGDLVAEVTKLERQLRDLSAYDPRLAGDSAARELAQKIEDVRAAMEAATIEIRLRGLPFAEFQAFYLEHLPRDGDASDRTYGFNRETWHRDLVPACVVEPEFSDEQWDKLVDKLTSPQWEELVAATNELNTETVSVPFSQASSAVLRA